jgi:hypothetical protein
VILKGKKKQKVVGKKHASMGEAERKAQKYIVLMKGKYYK